MAKEHHVVDRDGNFVTEGSVVRVLGVQDGIFESMPEDEKPLVLSMLGEEFVVEEIDENGIAWVWKSWPAGGGECRTQGLGLESHQMALVREASQDAV